MELKVNGAAVGNTYEIKVRHQPLHHIGNLVIMGLVEDIFKIVLLSCALEDGLNLCLKLAHGVSEDSGAYESPRFIIKETLHHVFLDTFYVVPLSVGEVVPGSSSLKLFSFYYVAVQIELVEVHLV